MLYISRSKFADTVKIYVYTAVISAVVFVTAHTIIAICASILFESADKFIGITEEGSGNSGTMEGLKEKTPEKIKNNKSKIIDLYISELIDIGRDGRQSSALEIQKKMESALIDLNAQGSTTDALSEAELAIKDAIAAINRERAPIVWAVAQNSLGSALQLIGARENDSKRLSDAVTAYRMAAEFGLAEAQVNLGYMYHWGIGVHKDEDESMKWYQRAAESRLR